MRSNAIRAAAVIVDDAEDPYGKDSQDPDGREVEAPQLSRTRDADPTRSGADLVFESDDEVTATREDSSEGLLRSLETEHAFREPLKLAFTELRLLDVEPDDRGLDGVGGPVPSSAFGRSFAR